MLQNIGFCCWLGMLPGTWAYVSAGAFGRAIIQEESDFGIGGGNGILTLGLGLLVTAIAAAYVTQLAKDAVKDIEANGPLNGRYYPRVRVCLWPLWRAAIQFTKGGVLIGGDRNLFPPIDALPHSDSLHKPGTIPSLRGPSASKRTLRRLPLRESDLPQQIG
ncbi:TVP38/TMEM64 family membrane protein [Gossypium australe]|uniref:TVP38/TMEM64 family membrane protein n=1 Tax=Gossypium australe TaxID=47621 RepID=A0A5B6X0A1_9ROSI|nr:TVP38/TMEM64 family membrane protein [Gossypium australe]